MKEWLNIGQEWKPDFMASCSLSRFSNAYSKLEMRCWVCGRSNPCSCLLVWAPCWYRLSALRCCLEKKNCQAILFINDSISWPWTGRESTYYSSAVLKVIRGCMYTLQSSTGIMLTTLLTLVQLQPLPCCFKGRYYIFSVVRGFPQGYGQQCLGAFNTVPLLHH